MSQEIDIEGKKYISSKRAAELTSYAQDYIGQLARKGLVEARRIGGLWYISLISLESYSKNAENFKPQPPSAEGTQDPGRLVLFDGKEYLSAAKAAEVTGYNPDYVGQLARSNTIISHQIGNRWYVEKRSLLDHKDQKDALLQAVQVESVGLARPEETKKEVYTASEDLLHYSSEGKDLMPVMKSEPDPETMEEITAVHREKRAEALLTVHTVPIRRIEYSKMIQKPRKFVSRSTEIKKSSSSFNGPVLPIAVGALATIVIVLSIGYNSYFKENSAYAAKLLQNQHAAPVMSGFTGIFSKIGDVIEPFITHELIYNRASSN